MTQAAIYCRISRDREGRDLGVERQEADCRALAAQLGVDVVKVLAENDLSASTKSRKPRPKYDVLLAGARALRWETIIAWSSSRLTRRPLELEGQIQLAEKHGTSYAYVKSPSFDLNTADGRATARTLAAWDAAEAERGAERVAREKQQAALQGLWRGGRRPYGYCAGPPHRADAAPQPCAHHGGYDCTAGVTPVPAEAEVVAWATRQVLLGASLRGLAEELNRRGEVTSTGNLWRGAELRGLLLRARNAGLVETYGQVVAEAVWPPLVSRAEWEAVRRVLADPARRINRTNYARVWLGSGLYLCGACGDGTTVRCMSAAAGRKYAAPTYTCTSGVKHLGRHAEHTDQLVEDTILAWLARPDTAAQLMARPGLDVAALERQARELRNRHDEQADAFGAGLLTRAQLTRNVATIRQDLADVEERLVWATADHPAAELVAADDIRAAWLRIDVSRRQAVVESVASVLLLPARKGRPAGWQPGAPYFDPTTVRIEQR